MMRKLQWMMAILALPLWSAGAGAGDPSAVSNQRLAERLVGVYGQSGLRNYAVDIETRDGVVTLEGTVASQAQRDRIVKMTGAMTGVRSVEDRLRVGAILPVGFEAEEPRALPSIGSGEVVEPAPVTDYSGGVAPYSDTPVLPPYSWPAYTPYNNYASMAYQTQYPSGAWPFIGPPNPYPMIPSGWRKVTLKWRGGYWFLKFNAH